MIVQDGYRMALARDYSQWAQREKARLEADTGNASAEPTTTPIRVPEHHMVRHVLRQTGTGRFKKAQ